MLECLIIGDSIASGIASVKHECIRLTEIAIKSETWYKKNHNRPLFDMESYRYVVISLGTNDPETANTRTNLIKIRQQLHTDRVIWILPNGVVRSEQKKVVESVATSYNDLVLDIKDKVGKDNIHPPTVRAYEEIGKVLK
jgi:hypothetical protein